MWRPRSRRRAVLHGRRHSFDLVNLNKVEIKITTDGVTIGTGCSWGYVYVIIQKAKCIAVGGISADVEVSGFTLGGEAAPA